MDTKVLIKQAKKGDKEALIRLVMECKDEYYKLAYIYMKNEDDTLDVMQDMIVILYENISKLKKDESFYSWSKTILVNSCKSKLKKNRSLVSIDEIKERPIEVNDNSEEKIVLERYLLKLSDKHQEVIRLRYFLDFDYETISQTLKIPIGTVKSRLNIGLGKLKDLLGGDYINE